MKKENLNEIELQNSWLRLKLEAETGMQIHDAKLPPALENAWLTHILKYEEQHRNAKRITVREFIGNPELIPVSELSEAELSLNLKALNHLLQINHIQLHTICEYDDSTIYKFITEELMDCIIDDIRIPGGMTCFIYEEFHPNHEYDVRSLCSDFLKLIFSTSGKDNYVRIFVDKNIVLNGKNYTVQEFSDFIDTFHELHEHLKLNDFKMMNLHCQPEEGIAKADIEFDYEMKLPGVNVSVVNEKITFHLEMNYNTWSVSAIESEALGKG